MYILIIPLLVSCLGLEKSNPARSETGRTNDSGGLPEISVSPNPIDFGDVPVGNSVEMDVTVSTEGEISLSEITIEDPTGAFFLNSAVSPPVTITRENDFVFEIGFQPEDVKTYEGNLVLSFDNLEENVRCSGNGTALPAAGNVAVEPLTIDFGMVDIGHSETRSFEVSNEGSDQLLFSDVISDSTEIAIEMDFTLPLVLSPGTIKVVNLSWRPTDFGTLSTVVHVITDDPETPDVEVAVTGTGDDICDICAPAISVDTGGSDPHTLEGFMVITLLGMTDSRTVRVENVGDETLTISNIYVNNDVFSTAGSFSVSWAGSPVDIRAGGVYSFTVTFRATGSSIELPYTDLDQNVLHILSNDPSEPDYVIGLSGTAI